MLDRLLSLVVSILLAFLVWLYARSRDPETLDNVPVPVQIALDPGQADQYELEVSGPPQVPVSFTGPPSRVRELRARLQHGDVKASIVVSVPAGQLQEGKVSESVRVFARHIPVPPGVKPTVVEGQNRITVVLHRLVEKQVPVRLEHLGEERITQVTLEPATVLVRGPQEALDRLRVLPTRNLDVSALAGPDEATGPRTITSKPIPLVDKVDGRRVQLTPAAVTARITLQPRSKLFTLDDVPIQFLCPPGFALRPLFGDERAGKISLRVRGPAAEEPPNVTAFVDLSERKWTPGLYEERVKLHLPRDFQLVGDGPGAVSFQLVSGPAAGREGQGVPEN